MDTNISTDPKAPLPKPLSRRERGWGEGIKTGNPSLLRNAQTRLIGKDAGYSKGV